MLDLIGWLLRIFLVALIIILVLSPFESLQWWAGWVDEEPPDADEPEANLAPVASAAQQFVIFLSGVGTLGDTIDEWERRLVDKLQAGLGDGIVLEGLFP